MQFILIHPLHWLYFQFQLVQLFYFIIIVIHNSKQKVQKIYITILLQPVPCQCVYSFKNSTQHSENRPLHLSSHWDFSRVERRREGYKDWEGDDERGPSSSQLPPEDMRAHTPLLIVAV